MQRIALKPQAETTCLSGKINHSYCCRGYYSYQYYYHYYYYYS